jgi:SPX domain protein involved in polyphosphate accumulation
MRWVLHKQFVGDQADQKAAQWINDLTGSHLYDDPVQPKIAGVAHFHLLRGETFHHEVFYEPWVLVELESAEVQRVR